MPGEDRESFNVELATAHGANSSAGRRIGGAWPLAAEMGATLQRTYPFIHLKIFFNLASRTQLSQMAMDAIA